MMNEDDDNNNNNNDKEEGYKDDTTPKNNVTQLVTSSTITRGQSAVKFGINSAAEFDLEMPTTEMKPMPPNVVQEFFPNDKVENQEKEEFCRETARNVSVLAEWDDDFDSYTQDGDDSDDDDDNGETKLPKPRRKQTPYKRRRRRRGNNGLSRPRKCRRESSIFGSAERGRSLLEDCHEETDDDSSHHHGLPFSVTINPDEYTSPSSNSLNDSMSSLETAGAATMHQNGRQSVSSSSACISPSSLRSDSILNATGSRSSKETPKSARTSSSTILKTVHASGALLHTNSPQGGELMPNQLKYSPKGDGTITGTQHSSSPSSSGSLCSDIMSLFTKHSLEDLLSRQLSILSTHPTEGLQTSMSDLAQWIASSGKCPSQFINDHVSKGLDLSSSLSLLNDNGSSSSSIASMFYGDSSLIDSALSEDNVLLMERCFELILGDTQYANNAAKTYKSREQDIVDADAHTIASCLKILQELSSFSWSSSVELRCAEIVLERFLTMSEDVFKETVQALTLFDEKLSEATNIRSVQLSTPRRLQKRKRKVSLQTAGAIESIKQLEMKLLQETERLHDCKRAREVFTAHLDIERASPIAAISEEIRTSLFPAPVTHNGSDFTFSLLDGLAEIAMNVAFDDETLKHIEIGCFFKDVEGVALRLLQVYLLGCTELDFDCGHGPFPLRNSLLSIILPSCSSEAMPLGLKDLCADATHMFFKIDNLVRTVHRIECESGCNFECDDQDNAILSITLAHENAFVLRIEFVFRNLLHRSWNLTTVPDDVIVTSAQGLNDSTTTALISRLQQRARVILKAEYHNPSLLQIVCDEVMKIVVQCL
jgi:hypothetical protein